MEITMTDDAACAAALSVNGRWLLIRRGPTVVYPGTWCFPGGKRNDNETPVDAAKRELAEEAGVVIAKDTFPKGWWEGDSPSGRRLYILWFPREFVPQLKLSAREADKAEWFTRDEVAALNLISPNVLAAIDAFEAAEEYVPQH